MTVRDYVWRRLTTAPEMTDLGYGPETVLPPHGLDTPSTQPRFVVLRWGTKSAGVGVSRPVSLGIWAYSRSYNGGELAMTLKAVESVLTSIRAVPLEDGGAITLVDWIDELDDFADDQWKALGRNANYRVVTSGLV